jgi:transposase-like protein
MAKGKPLTRSEKARIVALYAKGTAVKDICKEVGVHRTTVFDHIKKHRGRLPLVITQEVQNDIATMNYRGYSDRMIAKKLGLDQWTVCQWRNRLGLPVVPASERRTR